MNHDGAHAAGGDGVGQGKGGVVIPFRVAAQQGQLQGANGSLQGIASLIGPVIFASIFAYAIGTGSAWQVPGASFLLAGLMLTAAAVLAWRVTQPR